MRITLIRHAQALHNIHIRDPELIANSRLSEKGREQSVNLELSVDILVVSPLRRAIETYSNSKIKCKEIIVSYLFREQPESMDQVVNFLENEERFVETEDQVRVRAQEAKKFLLSLKGDSVAIITHGIFIYRLLEGFGKPYQPVHNVESISFDV
jgi:broad specificity phosphatase PhoE